MPQDPSPVPVADIAMINYALEPMTTPQAYCTIAYVRKIIVAITVANAGETN